MSNDHVAHQDDVLEPSPARRPQLVIYAPKEQKAVFQKAAKTVGLSMSAWARLRLIEAARADLARSVKLDHGGDEL